MTYSGIKKGTFYPMGGFGKVINAFKEICSEQGVEFYTNEAVNSVNIKIKISNQSSQTKEHLKRMY